MIQFPNIDPEIFRIGPIAPRWYGLMYVLSFIAGYFIVKYWFKRDKIEISRDDLYDLVFMMILGVILGGRLGYVLFYNFEFYLQNPLEILNVMAGGMSFHGGFIGTILGMLYFVKKKNRRAADGIRITLYQISDVMVVAGALGIALGRIGNFINAELFGRVTNVSWCMYFPADPETCRHPSQIYESLLEGWLILAILWIVKSKNPKSGIASWLFVALYGVARFTAEFFRQPDAHIGFGLFGLTRGQFLTLPLIIVGVTMIVVCAKARGDLRQSR